MLVVGEPECALVLPGTTTCSHHPWGPVMAGCGLVLPDIATRESRGSVRPGPRGRLGEGVAR